MNNAATIYYASKIFNEKLREADRRNFAETDVNISSNQQAVVEPEGKPSGKSIVFNVGPLKVILEKQPRIVNSKAQEVIKNQGALNMTSEEKAAVTGKEASASSPKQEPARAAKGNKGNWKDNLTQAFNGITRKSSSRKVSEHAIIQFFYADAGNRILPFSSIVTKSANEVIQVPEAKVSAALGKLNIYAGIDNLSKAIKAASSNQSLDTKIYNAAFKKLMNTGYWLAMYANQTKTIVDPSRHDAIYAHLDCRARVAATWVENTKIFLDAVKSGTKPVLKPQPKLTKKEEQDLAQGKNTSSASGQQESVNLSPTSFVGEFFYKNDLNEALEKVCGTTIEDYDDQLKWKKIKPELDKELAQIHLEKTEGFRSVPDPDLTPTSTQRPSGRTTVAHNVNPPSSGRGAW